MLRSTEWWLFRQALPKFIAKQGFRSHTLARMFPFLLFAAVGSGLSFFESWPVTLVVSALPSVAWWLFVTLIWKRTPPPVSTWLAFVLVGAYFLISPLLTLVYAVTQPENFKADVGFSSVIYGLATIVALYLVLSAVLLWVANIFTRYGLVGLVTHVVRQAGRDLHNSFGLLGNALPTILFLTAFLFFTPEIWRVTTDLSGWRLFALLVLFAAVIAFAMRARLREELDGLENSMSAAELERACRGTPLEPVAAELAPSTQPTALRDAERRNIWLVLFTRQLVRAIVIGLGVFLFFELFGNITVGDEIRAEWVNGGSEGTESPSSGLPFGISEPMLEVSALLAGFSAMYFSILSMTDSEYRQRYFDSILKEISRVLAVRAVYLKLRETHPDPTPDEPEGDPSGPPGAGVGASAAAA